MNYEERAFRRGYQQAYEAAISDVEAGVSLQWMRRYALLVKEWREGRAPIHHVPNIMDVAILDEDAARKLDEASPPFGSGKF